MDDHDPFRDGVPITTPAVFGKITANVKARNGVSTENEGEEDGRNLGSHSKRSRTGDLGNWAQYRPHVFFCPSTNTSWLD